MMAVRQTQSILDQIVVKKQQRLQLRRQDSPVELLQEKLQDARNRGLLPVVPKFSENLRQSKSLGVIAEIKKASPSKGLIQPDFYPAAQAKAYSTAGVQAISVLTEEDFFLGCDEDLSAVRAAVKLPILRKDFIIEPGQIYEARLLGASAVLLICALLDDNELEQYLTLAYDLGMEALVEIHDLPELMRALAVGANCIGINNRDLRTFHVNLGTTERLAGLIPNDRIVVAESGIATPQDMSRIYRAGASAVLIGETLMRAAGSLDTVQSSLQGLFRDLPR